MAHPGSITAVVMWENGDSGNVPFLKFEIQSQTDGKELVIKVRFRSRATSKSSAFLCRGTPFHRLLSYVVVSYGSVQLDRVGGGGGVVR